MKIEKDKSIFKTAAVLSVVILLSLLAGFYLIYTAQKDMYAEKRLFLQEISEKNALLVKTKIDGLLNDMEAISSLLSNDENQNITELINDLKSQSGRNEFKRMGIIMSDGQVTTTDGQTANFADREYFIKAMNGESCVSNRLLDKFDNEPINVFATPFYRDGKVIAVVFATKNPVAMTDFFTIDSFGGQGVSHIIESDGDPIIYSQRENGPQEGENLFDSIASDPKNAESVAKFREDTANSLDGMVVIDHDGGGRQVCYSKIGINDWYMVTSVDTYAVSQNSDRLVSRIIMVVAMAFFTILVASVVVIGHLRKSNKRLEVIAFVDDVTGYFNWNKFKIDSTYLLSKRSYKKYALLAMDIDKFKVINDIYGHEEGNKLLKQIASLIDLSLKSGELFSRVTSDNFAVILEYSGNDKIEKLVKYISEQTRDCIPGYIIQMSFGIYVIDDQTLDISAIYDRASMAKKITKERIDVNFNFYDESVRAAILQEKDIENDMKYALETGQFEIYLHPKYSVTDGQLVGAEALVRWRHPQKGMIQPNDFIPIFEKNGFIDQLDFYVFEQVCTLISRWRQEQGPYADMCVSLNLSRVHVGAENLVQDLLDIAEKHKVKPEWIELELTESAVFKDLHKLIDIMQDFKNAGFKLSLDDFGSGYSSLNALKDLPVDIIKLDRRFLQETTNSRRGRVILTSLIEMAKTLCMETVAEGVETEEQLVFLKNAGCDIAQGFFYAKPMSVESFEQLL